MRSLILLTIIVGSLFGNYEKSYEREQVKTDFNNKIEKFYQFFQAVVAYRKYLGG